MNKRHYEHTLPNIRGSLSNTYGKRKPIDFDNDRHSEIWWEEMEKAVVRHGVPYYEAE